MASTAVVRSSVAAPFLSSPSPAAESRPLLRHGLALPPLKLAPALKAASNNRSRVFMSASPRKELDLAGPTAVALLAAAIIPEIAEAATPGISPSLKNLLLSVVAGGVVLLVLGGAVAAVSTFDPVKRK